MKLAVRVLQQERVRRARDELGRERRALVRHVERRVILRVQLAVALDERELERGISTRSRWNGGRRRRPRARVVRKRGRARRRPRARRVGARRGRRALARGDRAGAAAVGARPREHVREVVDARERDRERVQLRAVRREEQVEEHVLGVVVLRRRAVALALVGVGRAALLDVLAQRRAERADVGERRRRGGARRGGRRRGGGRARATASAAAAACAALRAATAASSRARPLSPTAATVVSTSALSAPTARARTGSARRGPRRAPSTRRAAS